MRSLSVCLFYCALINPAKLVGRTIADKKTEKGLIREIIMGKCG